MAMQPPVRCIVGPFQPMGLPAAFRTMVRPNRLIKLNRANESRANPAWGMHACVRTCVRAARSCDCKRAAVARSPISRPSEVMPGRAMRIHCGRHHGVANLTTISNWRRSKRIPLIREHPCPEAVIYGTRGDTF